MTGEAFVVRRRPCDAGATLPCPWRRDTAGAVFMPGRLATGDFGRYCGTAEQPAGLDAGMFVCHKSKNRRRPTVCAGWLAAVGRHHLGVRLAVILGMIPAEALAPAPGWPGLFESHAAMVVGHRFVDREGRIVPEEAQP